MAHRHRPAPGPKRRFEVHVWLRTLAILAIAAVAAGCQTPRTDARRPGDGRGPLISADADEVLAGEIDQMMQSMRRALETSLSQTGQPATVQLSRPRNLTDASGDRFKRFADRLIDRLDQISPQYRIHLRSDAAVSATWYRLHVSVMDTGEEPDSPWLLRFVLVGPRLNQPTGPIWEDTAIVPAP